MNSNKSFSRYLRLPVLTVFLAMVCFTSAYATDDDVYTNIILINGTAILADFDHKGEIIKKYSEIPYYFSSYQSHETIVKRSMVKHKGLSTRDHKLFDKNHFLAHHDMVDQFEYSNIHSESIVYDILVKPSQGDIHLIPAIIAIRQKSHRV